MKTFAISIPKPCHEDWNKMTPDAKGAFCSSCQKSVYDFSNKTDEEIISVFESKGKEKVCGRFTSGQLSQPVVSFGNVTSSNGLAMFLYALLLAFGSTLFTGAEAFGQNVKGEAKIKVMGKMAVRPIESTPIIACGSKVVVTDEIITLGQTVVNIQTIVRLQGDTIFEEIPLQIDIDTIATIKDVEVIEAIIEPEQIEYMVGVISGIQIIEPELPVLIDFIPELINEINIPAIDSSEVKTINIPEPEFISPSVLEISVSPNPSSGNITLHYTLESMMQVRIELTDNAGKHIKTLTQLAKQYAGKYNVSFDISELRNGIYIVTLYTPELKVSSKIVLNK